LKATPDALGNLAGNPAFVSPRDPRPGADGPARFFTDANFDLTTRSLAIDAANSDATKGDVAPPVDFRGRGRVRVAGHGFPGTGPADIGAFEFMGTGGVSAAAFRVATSSIGSDGSSQARGTVSAAQARSAPASITVSFSDGVDPSTVSATD